VQQSEPPLQCEPPLSNCLPYSLFLIGRNSCGNWVVRDESGRRGGLFVGPSEAVKFAMRENGHHPEGLIMVSGVLELNMNAIPCGAKRSSFCPADIQTALARRVA
jgi:hypothetical protein